MSGSIKQKPQNASPREDATSGRDSLGKLLRRSLSFARLASLFLRGAKTFKANGLQALWREIDFRIRLATHREVWRYRADIPLRRELKAQRKAPPVPSPLVSVVAPLYNTPRVYLKEMVQSVLRQSYSHFELLLVDGSDDAHREVGQICARYTRKDARVRYIKLEKNEGIAANTNAGLAVCQGSWITLLDHDDTLQPNALYEVISTAGRTGADMVYSDEIVLNSNMKKLGEYHFKGDFGPDTLRGCNYITHLCAFTAELLQKAGGGERTQYDGAQDYDLILRLSEQAQKIVHIPKVLYFWRRHAASTASDIRQKPEATAAGAAAVQAHLQRIGLQGTVSPLEKHPGAYGVRYAVEQQPLVSVLIPSCDHTEDLDRCLYSLYEKAGWDALEVLVIDNNSKEAQTPLYYEEAQKRWPGLRVLHWPPNGQAMGFNYSAINNFAAQQARGEQLLLLNNDVEILSEGFVREMLAYSQRPDVGAVGAMLYYPDDTVQHAGLIVGIGGTAGVSHKGHKRGDGGDMFRLATVQNMSAVTGAALMVKKSLYEALGGLNEQDFAVAFNDVDFCLRLREKGLWNVFTPFAQAYHYESKSRGYDTEGPKKERFEREASAFHSRWACVLQQGDGFYNPHFTLKFENFGYR